MADTRWLSESEQRTWRSYLAMHGQLAARLNRQLQHDSGLSLADFDVLVQLTDRADERARAFELADALHWEKSRLSHQIARMRRRGLVEREDCPDDARGAYVMLTRTGREVIERAAPKHVETVRRLLFDHLTEAELETLRTISERVVARLDAADSGE